MNTFSLIGRLAKDPVLKETEKGGYSCHVTIVTDEYDPGTKGVRTDYIPCVSFGPLAKAIGTYYKKGYGICVSGKFQSYTKEVDGKQYAMVSHVITNHEFLPGTPKRDTAEKSSPEPAAEKTERKSGFFSKPRDKKKETPPSSLNESIYNQLDDEENPFFT